MFLNTMAQPLYILVQLHYTIVLVSCQGAPAPQHTFWVYDPINSWDGWSRSSTTNIGSGSCPFPQIKGEGGSMWRTNSVNTNGYHHISIEFSFGSSDNNPLDNGEYAEVQYAIDGTTTFTTTPGGQFTQASVSTGPMTLELPSDADNNNGVRIRFRNTGSSESGDWFYVTNKCALTGTLITSSPTPVPTNNPTPQPTSAPTNNPIPATTNHPTLEPTYDPTPNQTNNPTSSPTDNPTASTTNPTLTPSERPSNNPTRTPTNDAQETIFFSTCNEETFSDENTGVLFGVGLAMLITIVSIVLIFCVCCLAIVWALRKIYKQNEAALDIDTEMVEVSIKESTNIITKHKKKSNRDEVKNWLKDICLHQYYEVFMKSGYDSMNAVQYIASKEELAEIGVKMLGHQKLLLAKIKELNMNQMNQMNTNQTNIISSDSAGEGGYTYNNNSYYMQQQQMMNNKFNNTKLMNPNVMMIDGEKQNQQMDKPTTVDKEKKEQNGIFSLSVLNFNTSKVAKADNKDESNFDTEDLYVNNSDTEDLFVAATTNNSDSEDLFVAGNTKK